MKVRFVNLEEFSKELNTEQGQVDGGILRITYLYTPVHNGVIHHLSVVAGAVVRGVLLEFRHSIGDIWHNDKDAPVRDRARGITCDLEILAQRLNLDTRAGIFEP